MLHEPAAKSGPDPAAEYKTRLGVRMFLFYAVIFTAFVGINVASPVLMELEVFMGLNLAVVYGFGLIIVALVMALIYNAKCTSRETEMNAQGGKDGE